MDLAGALVRRCTFPPGGSDIDCAVSGGPDSLALMALACRAGCRVTAHHVDHGLRPGSGAEAEVVRAAAVSLGARFLAHVVDLAPGPNLEARARAARYAVMPEGVATGHTADDQAETVLINLMRGAGSAGLSAMAPGPRHPILHLRRAQTHELVASLGLETVVDASNLDPGIERNRVRHELVPLLASISRRDPVPVLARQAELLGEEDSYLDDAAAAIEATDVATLRAAPLALRRRAIRRLVRELTESPYPPSSATVERVLAVVAGEVPATELGRGARLRRSRGRLIGEGREQPARPNGRPKSRSVSSGQ